ncbi:MAG: hemerythrin domain-containing protein [Myxococcota bacterium]|jgi:hypothetical protein|nr:hemerythrin domain-containing protein [Myxococcota bacterium]
MAHGRQPADPLAVNHPLDHWATVRNRFVADHRELRSKMGTLRALALNVIRGDDELAPALRLKGEEFDARLLEHMKWEEEHLPGLLSRTENGLERIIDLREEHARQRERLAFSLEQLRDPEAASLPIARDCLALVRWVETDMAAEERDVVAALGQIVRDQDMAAASGDPGGQGSRD